MQFIYSLQSEWIKTKRSAAAWLCIIGGFFIPIIQIFVYLHRGRTIDNLGSDGWENHFMSLWQNMAPFLLPMGVILASSLITQMEFKNNTWKQLHTTPQSYTTIFFAKFSVIVLMTLKFFLFFNIGILLSAYIPSLIIDHKLPEQNLPILFFLKENALFLITVLPILAIQYLISLQFKNFLVPIGLGLLFLIGTMIGFQWKYIVFSPYSFCFLKVVPLPTAGAENLYLYATINFLVIMALSYYLYIKKKEKG